MDFQAMSFGELVLFLVCFVVSWWFNLAVFSAMARAVLGREKE